MAITPAQSRAALTDLTSFHDLVPVKARAIGEMTVQTVNARRLHAFLEVGRDFTTWIKGRIDRYGFAEGTDYVTETFRKTAETQSPDWGIGNTGGKDVVDYHISLDMAKELAMVENSDRGRQVRRYFIECERLVMQTLSSGGLEPRVIGGIVKSVVNKAVEEAIRQRLPEMVAIALTTDPRVAALDLISVRQLLDEAKAVPRKRNGLNRRIGNALRNRALSQGEVGCRRCPHSGRWLFPVDFAHRFMMETGNGWVRDHNDRVQGQGIFRLVRSPKKPADAGEGASA